MKKIKTAGTDEANILSPPAGYYASTLDWVEHSGLAKETILYEIYPPVPIPKVKREEELQLLKGKPKCSNKAFIVKIPRGRVWQEYAVISPDNKLLWDVSVEWSPWLPEKHSIFQEKELPALTLINETVAVLNHFAAKNFNHWMLEVLARIHLIQETGIKIDKYIINHRSLLFQLETLAACGITSDQIIQPHEHFHLQARELVVPSYVHLPNAWSINYVREIFLAHRPIEKLVGYERIYIKRRNYRKVINEAEILGILNKYGFKSILLEEMPLKKQLKIFFNAQVIVSPHGAGLTNLVFCNPGTRVVELFSPNFLEPHYWLISQLLHLDYHFIIGTNIIARKRKKPRRRWSGFDNMFIDAKKLLKYLD